MKNLRSSLGAALVIFSSFFYASYGIWTKLLGDSVGGYMASGLRSLLVVGILIVPALLGNKIGPINWDKNKKYLLIMLAASVFVWGPFYWAVLEIGVATSLTINYASIVIAMTVLGALWFGERFTLKRLLSLTIGLIGLALVFTPAFEGVAMLPFFAAAIAGVSASVVMLLTKKLTYGPTQSTVTVWAVSAIVNMPLAIIFRDPVPSLGDSLQWGYLLAFAFASIAASWSFIKALRFVEAGTASVLGLFEIVFAVAFGVLLFQEQVSLASSVGILLIMLAAVIPYVGKRQRKKTRPRKT